MIKSSLCFQTVKSDISKLLMHTVKVTRNLGRNKYVSYRGVVTGVYPALFTVLPSTPFNGKISFSYSEIMCGSVLIEKEEAEKFHN